MVSQELKKQMDVGLAIADMLDAVDAMDKHIKDVHGTRYLDDDAIVEMTLCIGIMQRGMEAVKIRVNSLAASAKLMVVLDDMGDELR